MSRRAVLKAGAGLGLVGLAAEWRLPALASSASGHFLDADEMATLTAVCDQLLPGPPYDTEPGAVAAGCPQAIDLLLAAFSFDPPLVHAGGPFSGRAPLGTEGRDDDMASFWPMDGLAELGWRIRIEGSRGIAQREFAGPVRGLQEIYRQDLAHLDSRAAGGSFADAPWAEQYAILQDQSDGTVQELVSTALGNVLEAMYGPPEYGGNRDEIGWRGVSWPGDVQPRGYSPAQVSSLDPGAAPASVSASAAGSFVRRYLGR